MTEREEKASIATGRTLPFSEWGSIIPDPRLVAAIVERLTFDAHIIETGDRERQAADDAGSEGAPPDRLKLGPVATG